MPIRLFLDSFIGLRIVLVTDIADDLLDDVLDRRQSGDATILIDDDRHVIAAFAKLR
jgi:hypothetical protein